MPEAPPDSQQGQEAEAREAPSREALILAEARSARRNSTPRRASANPARAITSGLCVDLGRRLDAIEARLPQGGPSALATSKGHVELTMLVMRVRYEASTASAEASRLTAACR
jgi:hypothetical protein